MDVIYLDFDGVCHPADVWIDRATKKLTLRAKGHELFESVGMLEALIAPYPHLNIVLSTSWVRTIGLDKASEALPQALRSRIVGATYDPASPNAWRWDRLTRHDTIIEDVERRRPARWLAIDDDALGWNSESSRYLVVVPPAMGLRCEATQAALRFRLSEIFGEVSK